MPHSLRGRWQVRRPAAPMSNPQGRMKDGIQNDIEEAAAHCTDARMHCRAFGTYQVCHDDVENRRGRPQENGPETDNPV